MKYILSILVALFMSVTCYSEVVKVGNIIKVTTNTTSDTLTPYTWQDKDGKLYPIYKTKKGAYYIIKISKKTGKQYKYYLPKEVKELL